MKKTVRAFTAALVVLLLVGAAGALWAQETTFDINWDDQTLGAAMQQLQRAFNVQYNLPGDLAGKKVTIHRQGVTVAQAVQELAKAAGIRVITDPNGAYVFQPAAAAGGGGGVVAAPRQATNPWAVGGAAVAAPVPTRPGTATVPTGGAYGAATTPGTTAPGGAVIYGASGQPINVADLVLRVIKLESTRGVRASGAGRRDLANLAPGEKIEIPLGAIIETPDGTRANRFMVAVRVNWPAGEYGDKFRNDLPTTFVLMQYVQTSARKR